MDTDIHFGDLEESTPATRLRPDRNKQFAVAAIGAPVDSDLPVFVDLDVMIEMEEHALEDTSVELGGVMLGGQYHDDDGRPFVLISDSLRAKHYEATKGSFKFTHDTWSEITRQREEFPEDLHMVGWYHTHPDWGVFLSGMDMFICDNFFNRPLDVALVIDPCRDDRGMFQWTGDPSERVRRTSGFYLVSSRFRHEELEEVAEQLSGGDEMAITRMRSSGGSAPTVVQVPDRQSWQSTAVMGMLTMQFLLVLLVAVKLLFPTVQIGDDKLKNLEERVASLSLAERDRLRAEAQDEVLDDLMKRMGAGNNAFSDAVDAKADLEQMRATALGQTYRVRALEAELGREKEAKKKSIKAYESLTKENKKIRLQRDGYRTERDKLRKQFLGEDADDEESDSETKKFWGLAWWWWPIWGALLLLLVCGAVFTSVSAQSDDPRYAPPDPELPNDEMEFEDVEETQPDAEDPPASEDEPS